MRYVFIRLLDSITYRSLPFEYLFVLLQNESISTEQLPDNESSMISMKRLDMMM
jgi:hypothetical protein